MQDNAPTGGFAKRALRNTGLETRATRRDFGLCAGGEFGG